MKIVRFKKIPDWLQQIIKEFDDSVLDFWFWVPIIEKRTDIVMLYARKYAKEIREDIFTIAERIKRESAVLQSKISRRRLFERIEIELADIQLYFNKFVQAKRKEAIYES